MNTKKYRAKYTEWAKQIVSALTLEERVSLMSGNLIDMNKASQKELMALMAGLRTEENHYNVFPYPAGGVEESNISPVPFCDGPRGVVCGVGEATCFPVSMARGASFDIELEEQIGECIGKEIRAFG